MHGFFFQSIPNFTCNGNSKVDSPERSATVGGKRDNSYRHRQCSARPTAGCISVTEGKQYISNLTIKLVKKSMILTVCVYGDGWGMILCLAVTALCPCHIYTFSMASKVVLIFLCHLGFRRVTYRIHFIKRLSVFVCDHICLTYGHSFGSQTLMVFALCCQSYCRYLMSSFNTRSWQLIRTWTKHVISYLERLDSQKSRIIMGIYLCNVINLFMISVCYLNSSCCPWGNTKISQVFVKSSQQL